MSESQTLAVGEPMSQKYGKFGFSGGHRVPPPGKLLAMCIGYPNEGKTSFLLSNPGLLLINCDLGSTPMSSPDADPPKAQIWPAPDPETGAFMGPEGPVDLTWGEVEKLKGQLVEAALKDQPRPETIAIDTLAMALRLLKDEYAKECEKDDFLDMDGRRAYPRIYNRFVDFCLTLRKAGYGVIVVCHLVNAKIPLGDDAHVVRTELTLTDTFYATLYPIFEMVFGIERRMETTKHKTYHEAKVDGKTVKVPKETITTENCFYLVVDNTDPKNKDLRRIIKPRVKMEPGEIKLPASDGWALFEETYRKSARL